MDTLSAYRDTPNDRLRDGISAILRRVGMGGGSERAALQRARKFTDVLDWTPAGIPQMVYDAGQMIGRGAQNRDAIQGAGGVGLAALGLIPGVGKVAAKGATKGAKVIKAALTDARWLPQGKQKLGVAEKWAKFDADQLKNVMPEGGIRTVTDPQNLSYPGVWKSPRLVAEEAAARARATPEDAALKNVFGVTRQELNDIGGRGTRKGNVSGDSYLKLPKGGRGSPNALGAMNDANDQRLIDTLYESGKYPELSTGMDAWYVADPLYQKLEKDYGPEIAREQFDLYRNFTSMASPGTAVPDELSRGGAANVLAQRGRFSDFDRFAGKYGLPGTPDDMLAAKIPGHPYHSTSQAKPMRAFHENGTADMDSPKVPLYAGAFGADAPGVNFQTNRPVPDAHFTRAVGVADMRKSLTPGASMSMGEAATFGPHFADKIAAPAGLEAVPAQARLWGAFSPQTGVDASSGVGAPKLELIARHIQNLADREGIPVDEAFRRHVGPNPNLFALPAAGGATALAAKGFYDSLQDPEPQQQSQRRQY